MNDQVDGKSLLGSYSCNEVPGQFTWVNGSITKAVINGHWLLIEDVDQAPPDVLSALEPLIQRRKLHILSRGQKIQAHPGFHLFMTTRLPLDDLTKLSKLRPFLQMIGIPKWTEAEMVALLTSLHPQLSEAVAKMITYFFALDERNRDVRLRASTVRDLLKWCQRCQIGKDLHAEDLVLEGKKNCKLISSLY